MLEGLTFLTYLQRLYELIFKDDFVLRLVGLIFFVVIVGNLGLYHLVLCKENKGYFDRDNLKTLVIILTASLLAVSILVVALVTLRIFM